MSRAARRVVEWAAPLVPGDVRRDWVREWHAELDYAARRGRPGARLLARAAGAWVHAAWLRWDRWRLEMLLHDLRDALRSLARGKGFALATTLTLALGIAANAAMFGAVRAVLLKPLPFPDPDALVRVDTVNLRDQQASAGAASPPDFADWRRGTRSFSELAASAAAAFALAGDGTAEHVAGTWVTGGFFDVLAVPALHGRTLGQTDDLANGPDVVVLSHRVWQQQFGGDPAVVGRVVRLDAVPRRVVGVMPPGFDYPDGTGVWVPLRFSPEELATQRGGHYLDVVGRLRPGRTVEEARAELSVLTAALARQYPRTNRDLRATARPLRDAMVGDTRPGLLVLSAAVALLLLMVCVNVASLVLSRALGRSGELAMRSALGASRGQLARGLLVESGVLAAAGGTAGLVLAAWAVRIVATQDVLDVPRLASATVDLPVAAFTCAVAALAAVLFGTLPAWHASGLADLAQRVRDVSRRATADGLRQRARGALIVVQMALAVVLLVAAGLLARSFAQLLSVDLGFDGERVQTFAVSLPEASYDTPGKRATVAERLTEQLAALPQVTRAAAVFGLPLSDFSYRISVYSLDGRDLPDEIRDRHSLQVRVVTPDYFEAMGIHVRRGRAFTRADRAGSAPVAMLSASAAADLWPGEDALGRRLTIGTKLGQGDTRVGGEVVGIVDDVRHFGAAAPVAPTLYVPHAQRPVEYLSFVVRTTGEPQAIVGPARALLAATAPEVPMYSVRSMAERKASAVAQPRVYALVLALFSGAAVLLAAIGIHGVLAEAVRRRTREIAVRMTLGAARREVVASLVRPVGVLAVAGIALGLAVAGVASRGVASLLFRVQPLDPLTYGAVAALLFAIAVAACGVPASRAARVDPVVALRSE